MVQEYARCEMLPAGSADARYRSITGTTGTGSSEHTTRGTFRSAWRGLVRWPCARCGANSVLADAATNTTHCNADPANAPTARLFTPHSLANISPNAAIRDGGMKCTNDGATNTPSKYLKYSSVEAIMLSPADVMRMPNSSPASVCWRAFRLGAKMPMIGPEATTHSPTAPAAPSAS